jgi:hypothetical protein
MTLLAGYASNYPTSQSLSGPSVSPISPDRISEVESRIENLTALVEAIRKIQHQAPRVT